MALRLMEHSGRTVEEITEEHFKLVGMRKSKLPGYEIAGGRVLLMVYKRPEKTKGGIILTDKTQDEEQNQGKACLVLALGPTAFVTDSNFNFGDFHPNVGDWVALHVYETRPMIVNGYPCRTIKDTAIVMKIPHPDLIY